MRKFWLELTRTTRFQILFYGTSLTIGLMFFLGPRLFADDKWLPIFTGLGIAFVSSGILGFAQRVFFFDDFRSEMDRLVSDALNENLSAGLFPFIRDGIEQLHPDRRAALKAFIKHIELEKERIIFIGSSLKGMLDPTEEQDQKREVAELLRRKMKEGVQVRFLLTHPALAFLREDAEGRAKGDIKKEIMRTLRYLVRDDEPTLKVPEKDVKLYKGTPTIFSVILSERMLVNPYTYQANAFENFCFEVKRTDDSGLYSKIRSAHYEKPWESDVTCVTLNEETIEELEDMVLSDVFPNRQESIVCLNVPDDLTDSKQASDATTQSKTPTDNARNSRAEKTKKRRSPRTEG